MENKNQEIWTKLQSKSRFRLKYPSEDAIRFFMKNFKRDNTEKILDMGCGAGRHILLAAESGLVPYGIDFSDSGVSYTKEVLENFGYGDFSDNIITGSVSNLPYEDEFFDGIICWGVLLYLSLSDIKSSIQEMYRVLKKGGGDGTYNGQKY